MSDGDRMKPLTRFQRAAARAPIWLYRHKLGWMMSGRFLLLNHIGRKSGLPRQAVVEVVRHDEQAHGYVICSGWGEKSQWFQNLMAHPDITIQVRNRQSAVHATRFSPEQGADEMAAYARLHPRAATKLARFMKFEVDGSQDSYRAMGRELPFIVLEPLAD
ncbi:MAG: nitroreductase family deazaflavin-dependent oxidoreductase [Candidatus Nanopelagicales bacterium]|nr:nitroreductase family deazaflavin-dependent oxidoreductase [Candidatus Nanopelagicales bacterium]MDZ4249358.1 nitroreductase family deazaflavin-dependent oxidoreductase [Candidatus Nanopelagicales bacterium]